MKADLHAHSTASDGRLSPSELVQLALDSHLTHLALTDHDSVEGLSEALYAAENTPLTVIPAVELSTTADTGADVHMLGLFIDRTCPELLTALSELREARLRRAHEMVRRLKEGGYDISLDAVLELAVGGSVGRSHIARALVSSGLSPSMLHAFEDLIGHGRPFYVPKQTYTPKEAVALIHRAGGLAFIAHPGVNAVDNVVRALAEDDLDGIEAFHADHSPQMREHYADLADELGLLISGGSDFHASDARNPPLGSIEWPESALEALLAAAERRRD